MQASSNKWNNSEGGNSYDQDSILVNGTCPTLYSAWPKQPTCMEMSMYQMNDQEKATRESIKALHRRIRPRYIGADRYSCLLWAYVRGFKYKRVERKCYTQDRGLLPPYEHNAPSPFRLADMAKAAGIGDGDIKHLIESMKEWLTDPDGAIAEPVRIKKPYVKPAAAAE